MSSSTADDVTDVRAAHVLDAGELASYLALQPELQSWFKAPLQVKQFGHGQSNPTFLMRCDDGRGRAFVLRKQPPGDIISETAHRVDREFRIMRALNGTDVPVPEMYHLCTDESVIGKPFYIMQFCEGRVFKDVALPDVPRDQRRACWLSLMETLARIHNVDVQKAGLEGYGKPGGYFERQVRSLSKVSAAQLAVDPEKVPAIPQFEQTGKRLATELPSEAAGICHGDYKMDNVIFHPTEPRVIAVIDWELSTLGHFGADLGNCLAPLFAPSSGNADLDSVIAAVDPERAAELGLPSRGDLLRHYCAARRPALDFSREMRRMWGYLAFYWWKTGVILQGIAARFARGQASSPIAEAVGQGTPIMGNLAVYALQQLDKEASSNNDSKL